VGSGLLLFVRPASSGRRATAYEHSTGQRPALRILSSVPWQNVAMSDEAEDRLVEAVVQFQQQLSGRSLAPWLIEAQLQIIDDRLISRGVVLERRLGEGRFLAIGAIATISFSIALGLLVHPSALLAAGWKLRRFLYLDRDWRPHIIAIYVQLEGIDRAVFEAIHWLSLEPLVTDFERFEAEDFAHAFGVEAPDLNRVVERVGGEDAEIASSMARLVRSEVLKSDGHRYWIAF